MSKTTRAPIPTDRVATTLTGDDVLHVIFVLDRSGSMSGKEADVIGGFNSFVDGLRAKPEGAVGVSYVRFDNEIELVWNDVPLDGVARMTAQDYQPRGSTALLDAVGMTVTSVVEDPAHAYHVITHTDGHENASREWTAERLRDLIKQYEAKGNWTFSFFGEGIDAWGQAGQYGFAPASTMSYASVDKRALFEANARVSNVMRKRKMRSTKEYALATQEAMTCPELSDQALEEHLRSKGIFTDAGGDTTAGEQ